MKKISILLFISFLLIGCKDKVYDEIYYAEHMDEAVNVLNKCKSGEIKDDNCKNAKSALSKEKRKEVINEMFKH